MHVQLERVGCKDDPLWARAAAQCEYQLANTESNEHSEFYRDRHLAALLYHGVRYRVRRQLGLTVCVSIVFRRRDERRTDAHDVLDGARESVRIATETETRG